MQHSQKIQIKKNYLNLYFNFLKNFIDLKKEMKIVFDASDGAMGPILKNILPKIKNLKFILINQTPNPNFPHHGPDPTKPKALNQIKKIILKNKADLGIIFDCDGDRAVFVDEKGNKVENAFIGYLLIETINKNKKNIVVDILTYESLKYSNLLKLNHKFHLCKIGTYFLKEKMKKLNAELGIEHSGHFYFKENNFKDDSLIASFKILTYLSKLPFSINQYQKINNFKLKTNQKNIKINNFENFSTIKNFIIKKYKNQLIKINNFEGLTFEFKNGFINIRKSNTENLLRIYSGKIK